MTEVAKSTPVYDDETLTNIKSFDDAKQVLADAGVQVTDISDYGDGFLVMDKAELVNVPFIILDYKFADGDFTGDDGKPQKFSITRLVTADNRKAILTDGSTGMRKQLERLERRGVTGGILCQKGLTVSEYEFTDEKGKKTPAKTYYFHGM